MSFIDPSVKVSLKDQFSFARAKKAYGAGIMGAVTAFGAVSLSGILADGKIDGPELLGAAGPVVSGFVLGFFGAWLPTQLPSAPTAGANDVLVAGDGLGAGKHEV